MRKCYIMQLCIAVTVKSAPLLSWPSRLEPDKVCMFQKGRFSTSLLPTTALNWFIKGIATCCICM